MPAWSSRAAACYNENENIFIGHLPGRCAISRCGDGDRAAVARLGVEVDFPTAQTCCGQPHFNSGYSEDARALARHTIQTFSDSEKVVIPSGSCAAMVKLEYPKLFPDHPSWRRRAEELAARTHELSDFLVNVLGVRTWGQGSPVVRPITWLVTCAASVC